MRLLTVQPEDHSPDGCIHTSMSTFAFQHAPKYEALSYAWDDPSQESLIMVRKRPVQLKRNLQSVLLNLRRKAETRILRVDAICIKSKG